MARYSINAMLARRAHVELAMREGEGGLKCSSRGSKVGEDAESWTNDDGTTDETENDSSGNGTHTCPGG